MTETVRKTRILLVEDSPSLAVVYQSYLDTARYDIDLAGTGKQALESVESNVPDLVLLDLRLPDMSGMDVLRHIHQQGVTCEVIIITAHGSIDTAIEAMRYGAIDFLAKPFDATRLRVTVANALEKHRLTNIVTQYQNTVERDQFHRFIGRSLPMQAVYRIIECAAPSKATVFITGESGTGKELCAEALHAESPRHDHNFVAINCAAIPRDLMESEIFGHVKGAFTGAVARRDGAATRADGGTLFLDELCEMDLELQSKLLRFIQTGRFQRVGETKEELADIRIVCATNRDPLEEVKAGRFREDLYYRLNVIPVQMPPLRDRDDDVIKIAGELLRRAATEEQKDFRGFSPSAVSAIRQYSWPGNVRELENVIRNIVVLNNGEQISTDMLPTQLLSAAAALPAADAKDDKLDSVVSEPVAAEPESLGHVIRPLWIEEKAVIERAIAACDGNIPRAAALLEISASTIYRKRTTWEKMGVDTPNQ